MENLFRNIFKKYDFIEKAVLIGSRAKGEIKRESDYDIILFGEGSSLEELKQEIDLKIPYKVDLILEKYLAIEVIKEMLIGSRILYKKIENKAFEKFYHKFLNFKNAFIKYENAIEIMKTCDEDMEEFLRDATIKRYEFTYEMFYKTINSLLKYDGFEVAGSRDAFRKYNENYNCGSDIEIIMNMLNSRNNTSHSYSLEMSRIEFKKITEIYYKEILKGVSFLENYILKELEIIEKNKKES